MREERLAEIIHALQCKWDAGHRYDTDAYIREVCMAIKDLQAENAKLKKELEEESKCWCGEPRISLCRKCCTLRRKWALKD